MPSLGDRLRAARKTANLTQKELSEQLGVTNTTISNWEQSVCRPDTDAIRSLCRVLNVQPNFLLGEDDGRLYPDRPTDDELKFALFDAPSGEITDEMMEEVKSFARFVRERERTKKG